MDDTGSSGGGVGEFPTLILTLIVGATALALFYIASLFNGQKGKSESSVSDVLETEAVTKEKRSTETVGPTKSKKKPERWVRESKPAFSHKWLFSSLKGHSGKVLDMDFSSNGKYLASCAEDQTVLIWITKDFTQKEHKHIRVNIQYDHATKIRWSPDNKAFMVNKARENVVEVYKVGKKPDGSLGNIQVALTFPKKHAGDVIGCGIACTGKFIMTCSNKTDVIIWDLKGEVLTTIDNYQVNTNCALVSPCGRFMATSGFTPDVKVWEVCFTRTGEYEKVIRAFNLTGHNSGVYEFSFNNDSSRISTVSKDGTWKVFDTEVEYDKGQDPYLKITGKYEPSDSSAKIALTPDGRVVAIATGNNLSLYSALSGNLEEMISDIHSEPIQALTFDPSGKYILTAGDRYIRIFHNIPGYRVTITDLEERKKKTVNSSVRNRIQKQIEEAKLALQTILNE